jgi:3-deoxy-D-manno-octulosonic-acid transferase
VSRFDLIYGLSLPALIPYLAWRRVRRGKYAESAGGMLGRRLPDPPVARPTLWVHAVSVGEVAAARAIVPGLQGILPDHPLLVSTITETGQAAAAAAFPNALRSYFPVDASPVVRRFLDAWRPGVVVLMETELWPNFLSMAAARGTRCFMINGRMSDRSFPRYRRFRGLLAPALRALEGVCVQTDLDAERFEACGVPAGRIRVTGNCKFDLPGDELDAAARERLGEELGVDPRRRWIVAGSTHPGEETLMLRALRQVRAQVPGVSLLLCPRHPDRFNEVAELVRREGLTLARSSQIDPAAPAPQADVTLLDRMGKLGEAYGLGEIAIVAGSFAPIGGHNLLEAAAHRIPVLYGPKMHAQREIHRIMREHGAGVQVEGEHLGELLTGLLRDPVERRRLGDLAWRAAEANRGAARRATDAIAGWLAGTGSPDGI